jgi:hypothetical protein
MPIGSLCRACGAPLRPDLEWCGTCYTRVTTFAARPKVHEPGTFVGIPRPDVRMSRWRASATTMGPVGRVAITIVLLLLFPWWAILLPLRGVWRSVRVPDGAPPTRLDRLRERHPLLARELRLPPLARFAIVALAVAGAAAAWLTLDGVDRLIWAGTSALAGLSLALASGHDL